MQSVDLSAIMLTGAPATGKSTITRELVSAYNYIPSPDITTRRIRPDEVDGVDKRFVSVEMFEWLFREKALIEPSLDYCGYQGNYYGSPVEWLDSSVLGRQKILTCVAGRIAGMVRAHNPEIMWVHLTSGSSIRESRLMQRGLTGDVLQKRVNNSQGDSHIMPKGIDLLVDTSARTLSETISDIVRSARCQ